MGFMNSFVLNLIVVTLGVLIALIIDNWKEKRRNKSFLRKAFKVVKEEIEENRKQVKDALDSHKKLFENLKDKVKDENEALEDFIHEGLEADELNIPGIKKGVGIRYFIGNHADLVDQKLIFQLSDIEVVTEYFDKKVELLMNHIFDRFHSRLSSDKKKFLALLGNVISSENQLLLLYNRFLEQEYLKNI